MLGPEIGLQLLFIPEAYGGMGGGARDCCAVTRETAKICLGVATAFFAIQLGADPLLVGATHEQKERWLGAIAEGDTLVAYAVTEPGAGSNVQAIQTRAEPITDGDGKVTAYRINGNKQFISTGGYADFRDRAGQHSPGPVFFCGRKGDCGLYGRQRGGKARHPGLQHLPPDLHRCGGAGGPPDRSGARQGSQAGQSGLRLHPPDGGILGAGSG